MNEEALEAHVGDVDVLTPRDLVPVLAQPLLQAAGLACVDQRSLTAEIVDSRRSGAD
jgi:hypothetical protein